jgi:hypothetical protein
MQKHQPGRKGKARKNNPSRRRLGGQERNAPIQTLFHPSAHQFRTGDVEPKHFDAGGVFQALSWNGTIVPIGDPAQGVSVIQRIGDEIDVRGIELRYHETLSLANVPDVMRLIIVQINEDSSLVVPSTVLESGDLGTALAPSARYNFQASRQELLNVLYDEVIAIGSGASFVENTARQIFIPCNTRVRFDPASQAAVGGIFFLYLGSTNAAGGEINFSTRVHYVDP